MSTITRKELFEWCRVPLEELERHPARKVPFRLAQDSAAMGALMARELVEEIEAANRRGEELRAVIPCGPSSWYEPFTALVNKSLVIVEASEQERRYRMLETIRQYGREKLAESGHEEALHNRHLGFFLQFAELMLGGYLCKAAHLERYRMRRSARKQIRPLVGKPVRTDNRLYGIGGLGDQRHYGWRIKQIGRHKIPDVQYVALQLLGKVHQNTDHIRLL